MNILLVGLNHQTAPVEVREQLAFSQSGAETALILFRNRYPKSEAAIISTCNRVEVVVVAEDEIPNTQDVVRFLAEARDIPVKQFDSYLYQFTGEQAWRHLFRVASGLDSMVLGESQIVNQVKRAYAMASEKGTTGRVLNRLFHSAFEVSKRVRSETKIGEGKTSVSSVAVDVARQIFDDFSTKRTLVVGAGEMAQLTCQYLMESQANQFVVASRTLSSAKVLADACNGVAVPFTELNQQIDQADIIITATACPIPFITKQRLLEARQHRKGKLLFIIDLAVPRNVDPSVTELENVYLYDIDALGRIVAKNHEQRAKQLEVCEAILDQEVSDFEKWLNQSRVNPLINQMYRDARVVATAEYKRLLGKCPSLSDDERAAVEQMVERLVGKFMHPCVSTIRQSALVEYSVTLAGALHDEAHRIAEQEQDNETP